MRIPTTFKLRDRVNSPTKLYDAFIPTGSGCYEAIAIMEKQLDAKDFSTVYGWSDMPYRDVSVSDKELSILTFCEGDVTLEVAPDVETYKQAILAAHNCYVVEGDRYLFGGSSYVEGDQPIAKAVIEAQNDDWRQFRLQTRFGASCREDIIGVSWDLGLLYRMAQKYLEDKPFSTLALVNPGGGGQTFNPNSIDECFKEAVKSFNPLTRKMTWEEKYQ